MAQFRIKTSKNEVLCPSEMEKHEKKSLFDKCKDEKLKLFCNCNGACEYKVRNGNWAIYPCSQGKQAEHEDWCPKSKVYLDKRDYNAGFLIDDETGEVRVHLSEPLMHREQNDDEPNENGPNENVPRNHDGGDRRYPQHQQGEITISAMVKKMNMLTFKHVAFYKGNNETVYPKTNVMIKKMFWAEKRTRIGTKKKSIADLDRLKDGLEFVYKELAEIPTYKADDRITRLVIKEEKDGKALTVPVYTQELIRALEEYENTYATDDLSNRNIILAGFRDKYAMYSLRFLLININRLLSESNYEVQMYNAICEIMNQNRYKEKGVFFYKPFEYGYGAYGDKYLEDGIIEFEETNKKIVIEVYGRNDEDYLERKDIKSQMLSGKDNIYIYIPWEAYNNEPLPYKRICAEIEGVLNEVNSQ